MVLQDRKILSTMICDFLRAVWQNLRFQQLNLSPSSLLPFQFEADVIFFGFHGLLLENSQECFFFQEYE